MSDVAGAFFSVWASLAMYRLQSFIYYIQTPRWPFDSFPIASLLIYFYLLEASWMQEESRTWLGPYPMCRMRHRNLIFSYLMFVGLSSLWNHFHLVPFGRMFLENHFSKNRSFFTPHFCPWIISFQPKKIKVLSFPYIPLQCLPLALISKGLPILWL